MTAFYATDASRFVGGPLDAATAWRSVAASIGAWTLRGFGEFAVEEKASGDFVGLVGPWFPEGWPEAEIAWIIVPEFQRRGYGAEAARRALGYAYDELGWETAISCIDEENIASIRLAESPCPPRGRGRVQADRHHAGLPASAAGGLFRVERRAAAVSEATDAANARAQLAEYRVSIDNFDAALIHILAERFRCTKAVGVVKAAHGLPPADPAREAQQIERLRRLAHEAASRPRLRGEIPELRHQGSDPPPRDRSPPRTARRLNQPSKPEFTNRRMKWH